MNTRTKSSYNCCPSNSSLQIFIPREETTIFVSRLMLLSVIASSARQNRSVSKEWDKFLSFLSRGTEEYQILGEILSAVPFPSYKVDSE